MTTERERLIEALTGSREYGEAFWEENITTGIAFQVREMRASRGWTQQELGVRAGNMAQERIHHIENPDYGRLSVTTLKRLASAFHVALEVRFISYSELVDRMLSRTPEMLSPPAIENDLRLQPHQDLSTDAEIERMLGELSTVLEPAELFPEIPANVVQFPVDSGDNDTTKHLLAAVR